MSYTYDWPQASPCSNIIIYTRRDNEVAMLVTQRAKSVGEGRALAAGGFDEVKDVFHQAGQMHDGIADTYREMWEELGEGLKTIIPYAVFQRRVKYLWDGMIAQPSHPDVHKVVSRTLEVTQDEMDAIMALPSTSEQIGKQLEHFTLNDDPAVPVNTQLVEQALTGFKYPHEVEIAKKWFAREEQNLKDRTPSSGPGW